MSSSKLIVITAPSGAGKTTIAKYLLEQIPSLEFSVSATTRAKRSEETEGADYYFLSPEEFKKKIAGNEFVEWEEVYAGTFYGTLKKEIDRIREKEQNVLFDVDVKGAVNLKKKYPDQTFTLFIKPPSYEILKDRLQTRATEAPEKIAERIQRASEEMKYEEKFDMVITNDDLVKTLNKAEEVVKNFLA